MCVAFQWKPFPLIIDFDHIHQPPVVYITRLLCACQSDIKSRCQLHAKVVSKYTVVHIWNNCWKKCRFYLPPSFANFENFFWSATWNHQTSQYYFCEYFCSSKILNKSSLCSPAFFWLLQRLFYCSLSLWPFGQNVSKRLTKSPLLCSLIHQVKFFSYDLWCFLCTTFLLIFHRPGFFLVLYSKVATGHKSLSWERLSNYVLWR